MAKSHPENVFKRVGFSNIKKQIHCLNSLFFSQINPYLKTVSSYIVFSFPFISTLLILALPVTYSH